MAIECSCSSLNYALLHFVFWTLVIAGQYIRPCSSNQALRSVVYGSVIWSLCVYRAVTLYFDHILQSKLMCQRYIRCRLIKKTSLVLHSDPNSTARLHIDR